MSSQDGLHRSGAPGLDVPKETLWIPAGECWSTDPVKAAERIAFDGRGGYCYHLNGALGLLLSSLGYEVHGHVGGVQAGEPSPEAMGNHLVLTVTSLPSDVNPSGQWYVDTGLGDALYEPLPLVPGTYVQEPFRLTLERTDDQSWTLVHDPAGGTGVDVIRGLVLARIGAHAFTGKPITQRSEWFKVLAEVFDLRFDGTSVEWRDRLWDGVNLAHRAWEASQG